jgi:hypothetical protein
VETLGVDNAPLPSSHGQAYSYGPGSYLFQTGAAPNFPGSWGLYPGSVGMYRPEASVSLGGFPSCLD